MLRFLIYLAFIWLGWKALKTIFRAMSGMDSSRQKQENGAVHGEAAKQRVEFRDVQDAEFTEINDREPVSK